ncbi:MAG: hypothetical protein RDV48_11375 [Candidatus Eremiobacteraeota bacterium]|nr:hypothetical protein [Candidatus Eremiobacteraeota bacterium]
MAEKRTINEREVTVVPAESIRHEKEYIKTLSCKKCGGAYRFTQQALFPEEKVDLLVVECTACGQQEELYFDISSFFGKP